MHDEDVRIAIIFVGFVVVMGCSSSSNDVLPSDAADATDVVAETDAIGDVPDEGGVDASDAAALPLDCKWAHDTNNCWRAFVASVDGCLGNASGGGGGIGSMSADAKSCDYATGRHVSFALPFDSNGGPAERDFTITRSAGKSCLHYVEHAKDVGFVATGPSGTLSFGAKGNAVNVTCPDGTRFAGDASSVAKSCADVILQGGVPGTNIEGTSIQRFRLAGSSDWDFACNVTSPTDAGPDVSADVSADASDGG